MRTALLLALVLGLASAAWADPLADAVRADMPGLLATYRDLHAHPELSFAETRSAALLAAEARKAGFAVTTGVGRTGVVAVMANGRGPVLMIRADMDALPVVEQTGLPFASTIRVTRADGTATGVMHACGHDTHMTTWIEVARRMAAAKARWSGTLVMIAQPAEEVGGGAKAMLDDGLYTRFPRPATIIAFHDSASLPEGVIGYADGFTMANVDGVDIVVKGVGGHGAYPASTKDPVVLAARIVTALQTLVAREIDPLDSGVVTVGVIQGGTKRNVIPDAVTLQLTVRSYPPEVRAKLLDGVARIARGEAIAAGMPADHMPEVKAVEEPVPAMRNTQPLTAAMGRLFTARFGADRVRVIRPQMGGEDFSRFGLAAPGSQTMLFFVGGVPKAAWDAAGGDVSKLPSLHSAGWAPNAEAVIGTASEALTAVALDILAKR